jgi:pilus assembly protein Flp/PilA
MTSMHGFSTLASWVSGAARRLARDDSGATAIEYAMIGCGIGVAVLAAVNGLGTATSGFYDSLVTALK